MTEDEHQARAMLLDLKYHPYINAYIDITHNEKEIWLDCDSLQELPIGEKMKRIQMWIGARP